MSRFLNERHEECLYHCMKANQDQSLDEFEEEFKYKFMKNGIPEEIIGRIPGDISEKKKSLMEFMQDFFIEFIVLGDLHESIHIKNPLGNCE